MKNPTKRRKGYRQCHRHCHCHRQHRRQLYFTCCICIAALHSSYRPGVPHLHAHAFAPVQESSMLNKNNKSGRKNTTHCTHSTHNSFCNGLGTYGIGAARCRCLSSLSSSSNEHTATSTSNSNKSLIVGNNNNSNSLCNNISSSYDKSKSGKKNWGSNNNFHHQASKGHDSFVMRMANHYYEEDLQHENHNEEELPEGHEHDHDLSEMALQEEEEAEEEGEVSSSSSSSSPSMIQERRLFMAALLATSSSSTLLLHPPQPSNAFEKAYPVNLDFDNDDSTINLQSIRQERIATQKSQAKETKNELLSRPLLLRNKEDVISTVVWSGALWFLLGSRNNPLIPPMANALYDESTESGRWVKDRNEGLFTPLPLVFSIILGAVFLLLGYITDRSLLLLAEGDSSVVLQLSGVALIGGASLELGRIASGEKMITRDDAEREMMLEEEFREFASKRLIVGGAGSSVHRSEVITAFRRYFAKYRVENDEYPLTDLEIERLLRTWNKREGNEEGLTSAGFLKGVKINDQAVIR